MYQLRMQTRTRVIESTVVWSDGQRLHVNEMPAPGERCVYRHELSTLTLVRRYLVEAEGAHS